MKENPIAIGKKLGRKRGLVLLLSPGPQVCFMHGRATPQRLHCHYMKSCIIQLYMIPPSDKKLNIYEILDIHSNSHHMPNQNNVDILFTYIEYRSDPSGIKTADRTTQDNILYPQLE